MRSYSKEEEESSVDSAAVARLTERFWPWSVQYYVISVKLRYLVSNKFQFMKAV